VDINASQQTVSRETRSTAGEVKLGEMCDACGQVVPAGEGVQAELTVSGAMCPSPMNFHKECYEKASELWHPDPDSYCEVDPLFPETGQWTLPEETRG
jgi:hypothetical protein